ncbi:SUMF1/EgtB/PvdO family nonheme iron enzyme [Gimesia aquarii]|uniref:Serine/threonine-protein kinase pkn1 n=1 Tax=Gimesia aquarii TaxID=2527964 RepID=A0A517VV42_9PLAN|nr:SUMF1/EgtB/PvdO family nonheme iron enzyme [Gimesia aquarii]QDT96867.1 Serine/threonine-protein kinase pkn1 [Gimesia aquarii]
MFSSNHCFLRNRTLLVIFFFCAVLLLIALPGCSQSERDQTSPTFEKQTTKTQDSPLSQPANDVTESLDVTQISQSSPSLQAQHSGKVNQIQADKQTESTNKKVVQQAKPLLAPFSQTNAQESQQAWATSMNLEVLKTNSLGMQLTLIPPGEFMMGSPVSEEESQKTEVPHRVQVTKPFYLGRFEVTQAEYQKIMGENPSWFSANGRGQNKIAGQNTERFPVDSVSWHNATIFCRKLSEREGKTYRLPTEAEWEYACRAGTTGPFHFGTVNNGRSSNSDGRYPYGTKTKGPFLARTTQVGSYKPNAFGLFDMHGNVYEWCADWFDPRLYHRRQGKLTSDPYVSDNTPGVTTRVLRGGSWLKGKDLHSRSAYRRGNLPSWKGQNIGFRVVHEAKKNYQPTKDNKSRKSNENQFVTIKDPRAGTLVYIPAGTFLMGSLADEIESWPSERPQHRKQIKKGFYIGQHEVTFLQFRRFVAETNYKTDAEKNPKGGSGYDARRQEIVNHDRQFSWRNTGFKQESNSPVVNVSWNDAVAFCKWLSAKDGKYYFRLPTEAEREYVGRAGTIVPYGWGETPESLVGNENISDKSLAKILSSKSFHKNRCGKGDDGYPFNAPVGSFKSNAFGLYDIHGNVSEWCDDVYVEDRYLIPDSRVPTNGNKRVLRGGSSHYWPIDCRVARRIGAPATETRCDRGFRVVREELPGPVIKSIVNAPHSEPPPKKVAQPESFVRKVIQFQPFPMDEPVTSFTVSEDNRLLICSHQAANQVSIWDVFTKKQVATLSTVAPRSVLSRGNQLFVANDGEGTISVFAREKNWTLSNQLEIEKPHIVHLSAAKGKFFKGDLIITCHGQGNQASYHDCHVYHLDLNTGRDKHVSRSAMATCSYDGRIVITQGSFNLSPSGGISAFAWKDFISGDAPKPIYKGGIPQTPYAYQVHPGSFWIANNNIFGGVPLANIRRDLNYTLIVDRSKKMVYSVAKERIHAHRLNVTVDEIDNRKVEFPKGEFSRIYHNIYRIRDYLLDHPIAFTTNDVTHFFVIDMEKNLILSASTPAFSESKSKLTTSPSDTNPPTSTSTTGSAVARQSDLLPARIAEGEVFTHSLPEKPNTKYHLMNGPKGLKLENNIVTWKPGSDEVGSHELKFKLTQGDQISFAWVNLEVVSQDLIKHAGSLASVDTFTRLTLEPDLFQFVPTNGYQSLLLLQGDSVKRLKGDGIQAEQKYQLPQRYNFLSERKKMFLALSQSRKQLDLIDQNTLEVTRSIPLKPNNVTVMEITDLAVHPELPVSYVAAKIQGEQPRYRVLVVDEQKGEVSAPAEMMGTWVRIDPAGKMLYVGYKDLVRKGTRFQINPRWQVLEIPEYGSIDFLFSYDLRRGYPDLRQYIPKAGTNGTGIRISPDGQRITYLSKGGTPARSHNLAGWKANNLKKTPVIYETKDRATTSLLAFHPMLNIVAVPGGKSAVLYDRETGQVIERKLLLTTSGLGEVTVDDLFFTPDGLSLLFVCNEKLGGRYLRSVPLKLSPEEKTRIRQGVKIATQQSMIANYIQAVSELEIDSLGSALKAKKITSQEIAKQFNQSVVLIKSNEGSASGFVVGRSGFILTCAHAVPFEGKIIVSYTPRKTGSKTKQESEAELVHVDQNLDLALLKMKGKFDLKSVSLDDQKTVESGEQVTAIGNPSAGDTILSQTLTTGVVSNPMRILRGQPHIQISAAVNPGNSGGPVFDEHGNVIGLVVLKANIEGAGFAVPSTQLRGFLQAVIKKSKPAN